MAEGSAPVWDRRWPGLFADELAALKAKAGESLRIDKDALATGQLIVEFDWPLEDRQVQLRAIYPDIFPRLRPTVQLRGDPSTFPKRHCSPDEGNLCLLGRDSRQWRQQWTLVDLLENQLADALNDSGDEDPQGEPAEFWWNGHALPNSFCLIDSAWTIGAATKGELRLRYNFHHGASDQPEFKALVAELRDDAGKTLAQWSEPVPGVVQNASKETTIPWIYIDEVLLPSAVQGQLDALLGRFKLSSPAPKMSPVLNAQWFAVLYKTELQHGQVGLGWLFLVAYGRRQDFQQGKKTTVAIVRTFRAGASDIGARTPSFQSLRDKKVALFGLGAIGAPVALELARNGCALLRLVDHDLIEPGNSIRWPLGASAWGVPKGVSLKAFIETEYPWTQVEQVSHHIGVQAGDDELIRKVLTGIDVAVDATASYGVTTALSDYCAELSVPLISLYASPPLTGGVVARYAPGSGCPTCLEYAHHDGSVPRAPGFGDESGLLQPPGCAERTFTGASFDLQELSLEAVRLVVETLSSPAAAADSVVHTLSLAADSQRISPSWRADRLPRSEKCACARRV